MWYLKYCKLNGKASGDIVWIIIEGMLYFKEQIMQQEALCNQQNLKYDILVPIVSWKQNLTM
jgi:hypothetical protein